MTRAQAQEAKILSTALDLIEAGQYEKARIGLTRTIARGADSPRIRMMLAEVLARCGLREEAVAMARSTPVLSRQALAAVAAVLEGPPPAGRIEAEAEPRTAYRPEVSMDDGLLGSKYGGTPRLTLRAPWPEPVGEVEHRPRFLFQLSGYDAPAELGLPLGSLVQIFAPFDPEMGPAALNFEEYPAIVRRIDAEAGEAQVPTPPDSLLFPAASVKAWLAREERPDDDDIDGPLRGDKLLGWPYFWQTPTAPTCPECLRPMLYLAQLETRGVLPVEFLRDGTGRLHRCPACEDSFSAEFDC